MKFTNRQIYDYSDILFNCFSDVKQQLPVKINFYLQKNSKTLASLAQEIEEARIEIIKTYGKLNEAKTEYVFDNPEDKSKAIQAIAELFNLEQDVQIYTFKLDNFKEDTVLSLEQMAAILFMIEE